MDKPEVKAPAWIDQSFIEKAIKFYRTDDSIQILSFNIKKSFSEHFASAMFCSEIIFKSTGSESETINVVIKVKPIDEGLKAEIVDGGPLFENEIKMYQETLPAMEKLLKKSGMAVELAPE